VRRAADGDPTFAGDVERARGRRRRAGHGVEHVEPPFQLGRCQALRFDGEVVRQYHRAGMVRSGPICALKSSAEGMNGNHSKKRLKRHFIHLSRLKGITHEDSRTRARKSCANSESRYRAASAFSVDEAVKVAEELGGPVWVVKAQIHAAAAARAAA
jgi:hypothetical protein